VQPSGFPDSKPDAARYRHDMDLSKMRQLMLHQTTMTHTGAELIAGDVRLLPDRR
jgi:hypothetical protein